MRMPHDCCVALAAGDAGTNKDISDLPPSISEVVEGPGALYRKGRLEGLYRQVRQGLAFTPYILLPQRT